jgi:hypothetical protein
MKLRVLEPITDVNGTKNGFGDKTIIGEVFEITDEKRALDVLASGLVEEVKEEKADKKA